MSDYPDQPMCPNCVTPWKCNGPHITEGANMPTTSRTPLTDSEKALCAHIRSLETALTESRAECERLRERCREEIRLRSKAAARTIAAETAMDKAKGVPT